MSKCRLFIRFWWDLTSIWGNKNPKKHSGLALEKFVCFFFITKCNICLVSAPPLSPSGGLHHAAARIAGENVYKRLKHEGGTHRVQRIPEVGLSSRMQRIHTGTMTVIVLPQPEEVAPPTPPLQLSLRSPGVISAAAHPLLLAGRPRRPEGPSHRHLQVPGRRGAKRQHHGQRGASRSPAHR